MATIDECIEFALKNIGLWWRYGISRHCNEWKYIIIGRIFESEIILIKYLLHWRFPKVVPMGALVVRRGLMKVRNQPKLRRVLKVHPFSYFHENTSRTSIPVCTTIYTPIHMTLCDLLLHMREVCCWGINISADGKPACSRMRILTDSAIKRNREEVLGEL